MNPADTTSAAHRRDDLRADPERLLAEWRALIERMHHLHGPEAAAMLGVPEAALIASRVGTGAVALAPQLAKLVSSMPDWGKVLVAVRSDLGVALAILDGVVPATQEGALRIVSGHHDLALGTDAIGSCYLFEDHDAHGHTLSLNWFDGQGDVIGRIFLVSKSGWANARAQLEAFALPDQARSPPARAWATPAIVRHVRRPANGTAIATAEGAGELMTKAILALARIPSARLDLEGRGAALRYTGPLAKTSHTPPAVHATSEGCKLHARPLKAVAAWWCEEPGEAPGLRFEDGGGGSLTLVTGGESTAASAWARSLVEGGKP